MNSKNGAFYGKNESDLQSFANTNILKGYSKIKAILDSKKSDHKKTIKLLEMLTKASYTLAEQVKTNPSVILKNSKRRHKISIKNIDCFGEKPASIIQEQEQTKPVNLNGSSHPLN